MGVQPPIGVPVVSIRKRGPGAWYVYEHTKIDERGSLTTRVRHRPTFDEALALIGGHR